MSTINDNMAPDRDNESYSRVLRVATGEALVCPAARLLDGTVEDADVLDPSSFVAYCRERTIQAVQGEAGRRIASGNAGALSIIPCLSGAMDDSMWAIESLENEGDVAVSVHLKIIPAFAPEQHDRALKRQMGAVKRAALLIFERSKDVACALLAVENKELDKLIDRLRLLDALNDFGDIGLTEQGRDRGVQAWNEMRRASHRLRYAHPSPSENASNDLDRPFGQYAPVELAEMFDLPQDALRKRLERFRHDNLQGWSELSEPSSREAKYLYKLAAVRPVIVDLLSVQQSSSNQKS